MIQARPTTNGSGTGNYQNSSKQAIAILQTSFSNPSKMRHRADGARDVAVHDDGDVDD